MAQKNTTAQIHISLTGDFNENLQRLADHFALSRSAIIRMAVKQLFDATFSQRSKPDPQP